MLLPRNRGATLNRLVGRAVVKCIPPLPLAQALPCLSMRARLTVVFLTALFGFLLMAPALSKHGDPSDRCFPDFQRSCARGRGVLRGGRLSSDLLFPCDAGNVWRLPPRGLFGPHPPPGSYKDSNDRTIVPEMQEEHEAEEWYLVCACEAERRGACRKGLHMWRTAPPFVSLPPPPNHIAVVQRTEGAAGCHGGCSLNIGGIWAQPPADPVARITPLPFGRGEVVECRPLWPSLLSPSLSPEASSTEPATIQITWIGLSKSSLRVRSTTTVICGIIVALDSSEP